MHSGGEFGGRGFTPDQIRAMTLPEIALAIDDDFTTPRAPRGGQSFSMPGEREAYAKWWRSLTPRQRLERAREKHA